VGATALLTALCWGAWAWASSNGHATIGVIAGVLLVPAAIALAGSLALAFGGLARLAAERIVSRREQARGGADGAGGASPAAAAEPPERVAA
jgi:TRAP-type C4-dicarboxylate transport system permease small subunit